MGDFSLCSEATWNAMIRAPVLLSQAISRLLPSVRVTSSAGSA